MADHYRIRPRAALGALVLLTACGGGGQPPESEQPSRIAPQAAAVSGPDSFLLFPNPLVQIDGQLQSNTEEYAKQYYKAIDPSDSKNTLQKWKDANCLDAAGGVQVSAVFRDPDLGYGRRMTGRHHTSDSVTCKKDSVAFMVENYLVNPGGKAYGDRVNLDAAIVQDRQWRANVNAIEFSPGPGGGMRFAKFYSFDPVSGERRLTQDMDGRGEKALPGVCLGCHGGRVDPLDSTVLAASPSRFALLLGPNSRQGDARGRLHPFEVGALEFSDQPGYTRADQQGALKALNRIVLCSYPRSGASTGSEDTCRQPAEAREWQGGADTLIKGAYGGNGLPAGDYREPAVPVAWSGTPAREKLYRDVVVPYCRGCHMLRGTGQQSAIDFSTADGFDLYAARHRHLVFERGNMPMSRLAFERFWNSDAPTQLADYLQTLINVVPVDRDAAGKPLRPGRPVADPGPNRRVHPGATRLSVASLYADGHQWTLGSYPGGAAVAASEATLAGADTANPMFTALAPAAGKRYLLTLVSSRGAQRSAAARLVLYVNASAGATDAEKANGDVDPANIDLARMQGLLAACTACHTPALADGPPISFLAAAGVGEADALYQRLRGAANFTNPGGSVLLRKPAGHAHGGNRVAKFDDSLLPGDTDRSTYDEFVNWIVNGGTR